MNSCVFTGSFDPFTVGHIDVVKRAAKAFDKVYVVVLNNDAKETMFNMEQRKEIAVAGLKNLANIEVLCYNGLAVNIVQELGSKVIIRGIRNDSDLDYEREMAFVNSNLSDEIETFFVITQYPHISSTAVRELIRFNGKLENVLTKEQINVINNIRSERC